MKLSEEALTKFHNDGYIHLKGVFKADYAMKMQDEIWQELEEEFGILKNDKRTWRTPPHSPRKAKFSNFNDKVINSTFRGIIDHLLGKNSWTEPKSWGGFLITFPTDEHDDWDVTHQLWHWDYELFRQFELQGLLIFSFFSEVKSQGGGTLALTGSHRLLEKYYHTLDEAQKAMSHGKQRKHFFNHYPWLQELTRPGSLEIDRKSYFMDMEHEIEGVGLRVVELTGDPGDVVFCHPRLIHAPAAINLTDQPRIMRVKFLW